MKDFMSDTSKTREKHLGFCDKTSFSLHIFPKSSVKTNNDPKKYRCKFVVFVPNIQYFCI